MTAPALKQQVAVCIGKAGQAVGQLTYVKEGAREYSAFAYGKDWLSDPARFEVSPDLAQVSASVQDWCATGLSPDVGLLARELNDFAPAFEHDQMDKAWGGGEVGSVGKKEDF